MDKNNFGKIDSKYTVLFLVNFVKMTIKFLKQKIRLKKKSGVSFEI